MERGRLFFHYLADEDFTCERDGDGVNGEPRFKLCIVGEEERIEIRDLTAGELEALREKIGAALDGVPREAAPAGQAPHPA